MAPSRWIYSDSRRELFVGHRFGRAVLDRFVGRVGIATTGRPIQPILLCEPLCFSS